MRKDQFRRRLVVRRLVLGAALLITFSQLTRAERLPIKTYTTADGLARDQVNRIVRDSHGFLWFCTAEGLSRFDGYTFTNYTMDQGLPHREVYDLIETRSGDYWIATGEGVCRFNPTGKRSGVSDNGFIHQTNEPLFVVYHSGEEPAARGVTTLVEGRDGAIWCGTWGGLYRLERAADQVKFTFVDVGMPNQPADDRLVQAVLEDRQGALWVGTLGSGLYRRWPNGQVEHYTTQQGLPDNAIQALLEDRTGRLWVGTRYHGLFQLAAEPDRTRPIVARAYTEKDGLPINWINSLFQASDGRFWIGLDNALCELVTHSNSERTEFRTYTTAQGLSHNKISGVAEDRDGNLWIASDGGGAMKLARSGFTTYNQADGLESVEIASVFENAAGELYTISHSPVGRIINRFDGKRFSSVRPDVPRQITSFGWGWYQVTFQDHAGEWWVATNKGIYRFPKVDRVEQLAQTLPKAVYTMRNGLINDEVFRLFEDSRGDVWVQTISYRSPAGLTRWERATETLHSFSEADGLQPPGWVTAFREDLADNLWIGFYHGGIARYRNGRFESFSASDGAPMGRIETFYLDHAGRLWIASTRGVSRIDDPKADRPRFISYTTAEGLSSNDVLCLTEDQWGRIYIGTGRGLDRLEPATGRVKHYTMADGLASGSVGVGFRDHQGALWFTTNQGLSRLVPEPDHPRPPPPILISGLRIAGVTYPISELGQIEVPQLELGSAQNQINIDFVGLGFGLGEALKYQYKLEGADRDWGAPTDQRTVNYASLRPGTYRFFVRAVSTDGMISSSPATAAFLILPPLWQRWWVLALVAMTVSLAAYSLYRRHIARLLELERVRTRIATDLHDEIGSNLSLIAMVGEVANRRVSARDSQMSAWLSMIASTSRETVDAMSDIVWAVNPSKDRLVDLTQRMRRVAEDLLTARDIALRFSAPDKAADVKLGADTRREVFMVFKESLNNIVRHSQCTQTEVEFQTENGWLSLKLSDNGKGFDTSSAMEGNGLASMRRRALNLGGKIEVISHPGSGATIRLRVPVDGHRK